jgi:hypothetical protein
MKRYVFALSLAAATALACVNLSDSSLQLLVVAPILDSVFVGDTLAPRDAFLQDENGVHHDPGPVMWSISPTSVATIDAAGRVAGKSKGTAIVFALASGALSAAVVIVSRPLEMTLLMDTIYVMPTDTITVPLAIAQKTPGVTTIQFDPSPMSSVYTIDAAGLVTAQAAGGPVLYRAHLSDGTNTVSDSGAIVVMSLTDTLGSGKFFMTAFGTAIRHQSGGALALNYARLNGKLAFRLVDTLTSSTVDERVLITVPDSVQGPRLFEIDSISPQEATSTISTLHPTCNPKRPWALWASLLPSPGIVAYSHGRTPTDSVAGSLSITQYAQAAGGGGIISGRYLFKAQRVDLYGDPLGSETIRGTFVAPLRERHTTCQG